MVSKSRIVKYIHKDSKNRDVIINKLYRDENTGMFYVRDSGKTRSLETDNFQTAKLKIYEAIKNLTEEPAKKSVNKLVSEYFADLFLILGSKDTRPKTMTRYRGIWELSLKPFFGSMIASDINQQSLTAFITWHKRNRGTQLFNDFKLLKQIIHLMQKTEKIPLIDFTLPKNESDHHKSQKGTFITESEFLKILGTTTDSRFKFIFELAYTTGMRKGEILKLRKEYLKREGETLIITLPSAIVKTRKGRKIPLSPRLADMIQTFSKNSGYVFPALGNKENHIPEQLADRAWRIAKTKAGIKRPIRFHDLRHTCATNLANLGVDSTRASTLLGMSIKVYEDIYLKKDKLDLTSIVNSMGLNHEPKG